MPYTYRDYPVLEASVCLFHGGTLESGVERVRRGDIANIRGLSAGTGLAVPKRYLFVPIYGLDEPLMFDLQNGKDPFFDKKRFAIPLGRLKQLYPPLDIAALRDENALYQPFILTDPDTGYFHGLNVAPFPVHGLVWDKETMRYL